MEFNDFNGLVILIVKAGRERMSMGQSLPL
jgi:hypothetical protein